MASESCSIVTSCRICHGNLIPIFDLGNQALSSRFPSSSEPDPIEAPLHLVKCDDRDNENCGLLQLEHNVSGKELYLQHYGYRSGLNATMRDHLGALVSEIESRIAILPDDIVVDVGSNDATLLKSYTTNPRRVGIDPTGTQFRSYYSDDIVLVPNFFTAEMFRKNFPTEHAKVITTIAMFYDLPDPIAFVTDLKSILAPDGIWVSEQSYTVTMLEHNSFDTICHEHLEYYTIKQMDYLAKKVGLKIIDVTLNACNGGSFRVTFAHADSDHPVNTNAIDKYVAKEVDLNLSNLSVLNAFIDRCQQMKRELVDFLTAEKAAGKSIYLYGASTKGNTLLQYYGLDSTIITAAAERNPEKYGCRTPRTHIPIIPETEMRASKPDYLLVLPWHFKAEFLAREKEYLNQGGQIIFPLPTLDIVKKKRSL